MSMTAEQIKAEALKLPEQARAELFSRLMRSLCQGAWQHSVFHLFLP